MGGSGPYTGATSYLWNHRKRKRSLILRRYWLGSSKMGFKRDVVACRLSEITLIPKHKQHTRIGRNSHSRTENSSATALKASANSINSNNSRISSKVASSNDIDNLEMANRLRQRSDLINARNNFLLLYTFVIGNNFNEAKWYQISAHSYI